MPDICVFFTEPSLIYLKLPKDFHVVSNADFGVTEDSKLYFDLSTPGRFYQNPNPTEPSFANPRRESELAGKH